MARRYYSSKAESVSLSNGVDASATALIVSGTGGFPSSYPFTIVIEEGVSGKEELCDVTGAGTGGATWTVVRGADGTDAKPHSSGASVRHAVSARDFDEPNAHIDASTNVHGVGVSNAVVGTGSAQTLTNKTISGASNTVSPSSLTVSTGTIQDGAVTTVKIADANVTTAKIADLNVTEGKIAANAVTSGKINAGAVTSGKIAAGAVGTTELANDAVTAAKIAAGAVDTAELANDAVTAAKIAAGEVGTSELATGAVTTAKIADGNVTQAKLAGDLATFTVGKTNVSFNSSGWGTIATGLSTVTGFVGQLVGNESQSTFRVLSLLNLNSNAAGTSTVNGSVRLLLQNNSGTKVNDTNTVHWVAW